MNGKMFKTGILSLIVLLVGVSLALATVKTIAGRVEAVDPTSGMFTLTTDEGSMNLTAPAKLLYGVELGVPVEVDLDGKMVKAIRAVNDPEDKSNTRSSASGSEGGDR